MSSYKSKLALWSRGRQLLCKKRWQSCNSFLRSAGLSVRLFVKPQGREFEPPREHFVLLLAQFWAWCLQPLGVQLAARRTEDPGIRLRPHVAADIAAEVPNRGAVAPAAAFLVLGAVAAGRHG
jgi:hypothetical protein